MKVPVLGDITIAKFKKSSMLESERGVEFDDVTLYKLSGDECGQSTLDKKYESYAIKFAGLKEGTCASVGYSVPDGSKTMKVPVLGDITIAKFKKSSMVGRERGVEFDDVTLYKLSGDECGQSTLDKKYESY